MALSLPQFRFVDEVDNLTGTPSAATPGTSFTAGANSADGTAVTLLSALAFDVHHVVISLGGISSSGADGSCLADLLVDPAGGTTWASLIDDLVCGFTPVPSAAVGLQCSYCFPLFIKSGSSLGLRARTAHTANLTTGRCVIWCYGNPTSPEMWWCGQRVETLGVTAASSKGTSVTPGNTGADGSWTSVGATTGARYGFIQLGINGSDATMLAVSYQWLIGISSVKLPGSPKFFNSAVTAETVAHTGFGQPIWCDIPSATQMQVMGTCSGTAEAYTVALYGVY